MTTNKVQNNEIININILTNVENNNTYCSKCLALLDEDSKDRVKDHNGNDFCDSECRRDYYTEIRQDMDDLVRELF